MGSIPILATHLKGRMKNFNSQLLEDEPYKLILLSTGEWAREYPAKLTRLGNYDTTLSAIMQSCPFIIDPFFNGWGLSASVKDSQFTVFRILKEIRMKSSFVLDDSKKFIYPTFSSTGAVKMDLVWTPPEDMKLVLISCTGPCSHSYLVAGKEKKCYRLPLSNLYNDCRLCLGNNPHLPSTGFINKAEAVMKIFEESEWANDLTPNLDHTQKIFRFDTDGKQVEGVKLWEKDCVVVSSIIYNHIMERIMINELF